MIYDYIIIGTGVAGLNAARLIPKNKRVLILCKMSTWNCNTFWAQGGIASAVDEADIPAHIQDTLTAGVNYNDKEAVEIIYEQAQINRMNKINFSKHFEIIEIWLSYKYNFSRSIKFLRLSGNVAI